MKKIIVLTTTMSAVALLGACTTTGNVERNAAIGAAGGAVAGAIIGNNVGSGDAKTGAIIGAIAGGAGGAYSGQQKDKHMGEGTHMRQHANGQQLHYDQSTGRYFWVDPQTGKSYYENGQLRG